MIVGSSVATRRAVSALAMIVALSPCAARAHGRRPFVERIAFDPSDAGRIVLQFSFGLVASEDSGASWTWVCAAAYGVDPSWEEPDVIVTRDGTVVLGAFDGAVRSDGGLCSFERPGGSIADTFVIDLARAEEDTIYAVTSRGGGEPDYLQRSRDGGRTWAIAGDAVDALLQSVEVAPSDPQRVYATAVVPATDVAPRRMLVLRSDDAGASFVTTELAAADPGEVLPRIAGVDPGDEDRVFLRVTRDALALEAERLLVSDDGAETFRTALEQPRLRGFAITTETAWAGSALGGLWRADASALDFVEVSAVAARCIEPRGEELWLCTDEIADGFSVGRSLDGGATVEPMLALRTIEELPVCPTCSTTAVTCPFWLDDLTYDFATYFGAGEGWMPLDASVPSECLDAGAPDAGAPVDGGGSLDASTRADAGAAEPPAGCGCRASSRERSSLSIVVLFALAALLRPRRGRW